MAVRAFCVWLFYTTDVSDMFTKGLTNSILILKRENFNIILQERDCLTRWPPLKTNDWVCQCVNSTRKTSMNISVCLIYHQSLSRKVIITQKFTFKLRIRKFKKNTT